MIKLFKKSQLCSGVTTYDVLITPLEKKKFVIDNQAFISTTRANKPNGNNLNNTFSKLKSVGCFRKTSGGR